MTDPIRIVVIGGGISGLAAAHRLSERLSILGRPYEVQLFEAATRIGGVIGSFKRNDFLLEAGPDSFIATKRRGIGLCQDLGLQRDLIETNKDYRRSFIALGRKLIPVPEGFFLMAPSSLTPTLLSPLLSWKGKLRLLKEYFVPPQPQADESVGSFVRRRLGDEVLTHLAQPLLSGIYSADPEKLSLRATFPQFLDMEKTGGVLRSLSKKAGAGVAEASGARYALFMTLRNGVQSLVDALGKRLGPTVIHTEIGASALEFVNDKWKVYLSNEQTVEADAVCVALQGQEAARLANFLDPRLATLIGAIPYADSLTANFAFKESDIQHPLNGFGFVVPEIEKRALSACTFVHRKFSGRAPNGYALLRAYTGGKAAAAIWSNPDADILTKLHAELKMYLGIKGEPLFSTLQRYRLALPQYAVGHLDRLKEIDDRIFNLPGVAYAGNWRHGVGIPDCIESGENAADALIMHLCKV